MMILLAPGVYVLKPTPTYFLSKIDSLALCPVRHSLDCRKCYSTSAPSTR